MQYPVVLDLINDDEHDNDDNDDNDDDEYENDDDA